MKIFLSFLQGKPDHPIPAYSFWEYYIKKGIEEAGHSWMEVPYIDWAYGLVPQTNTSLEHWKQNSWDFTLSYIKKNRPDLFLSYLYPHQINGSAVKAIHDLGIPTVNFFCDNVRQFQKIPPEFQTFDLNWVPEFKALKMYQRAKLNFLNLPMPMWVDPVNRKIAKKDIPAVSFIGSRDIQRQILFEKLVSKPLDFDLKIYGASWLKTEESLLQPANRNVTEKIKDQIQQLGKFGLRAYIRKMQQRKLPGPNEILLPYLNGKPTFEDYTEITKSSAITLGVNRYPSILHPLQNPDTYSRLRDIEAPMLGACYLTEWTQGLDKLYDLENEIHAYTDEEDLANKAASLIKNKSKRDEMRFLAQKRALETHSIPASLQKVFNYFNIAKSS